MRRRLDDRDDRLFREVTGMDDKWRVVWADEGAPDELHLRDVVTELLGSACRRPSSACCWRSARVGSVRCVSASPMLRK